MDGVISTFQLSRQVGEFSNMTSNCRMTSFDVSRYKLDFLMPNQPASTYDSESKSCNHLPSGSQVIAMDSQRLSQPLNSWWTHVGSNFSEVFYDPGPMFQPLEVTVQNVDAI